MNKIQLDIGKHVFFEDEEYEITKLVDLKNIFATNIETGKSSILPIEQLHLKNNRKDSFIKNIDDISEKDWEEANKRLEIIKPLLDIYKTEELVKTQASKYNLHPSTLYRWIDAYEGSKLLITLVPKHFTKGGKGKIRVDEETDLLIKKTIEEEYLSSQKKSARQVYFSIVRKCKNARIIPPSENTVRSRIKEISEKKKIQKRESGRLAVKLYNNTEGVFPEGKYPLDFIQIDHTPIDIIIVDEVYRKPIRRPYLTIAIDVYSRMVTGFFISLDPPSYFSVSQCFTQSVLQKDKFLRSIGVEGEWNIWGLPKTIGLDNAGEFRGREMQRACEHYGIELNWRPVARPQYGAHIERLIGTSMKEIHTLPGTTFSNVKERGEYKSDKYAQFTLKELEQWYTEFIVNVYHKRLHHGINTTPEKHYEAGIFGNDEVPGKGLPEKVSDEDKFRISLLPSEERTIQQFGVKIDNIQYYADCLRRWIKSKDDKGNARKFTFKRDFRDISTIWFYDPDIKEYFPVPYRNISYPPISIWDLRSIKKFLDDKQIKPTKQDELSIFQAYEKMKKIEEAAAYNTRSVRRKISAQKHRKEKQKFDNITKQKPTTYQREDEPTVFEDSRNDIQPFYDIEIL